MKIIYFFCPLGGSLIFTALLNSIVHIFMYTYYSVALFGPGVQAKLIWFKKSITIIQIVQFLMLLTNALASTVPSCNSAKWFLIFYIPNIFLLLFMFVKFYSKNYLRKKTTKTPINNNNGRHTLDAAVDAAVLKKK